MELENKVTKKTISVELSNETGDITIGANRLSISTTNFQLTKEGSVTCSDITITGGSINVASEEQKDFITLLNTTTNRETKISADNIKIGEGQSSLTIAVDGIISLFGDYNYSLKGSEFRMYSTSGDEENDIFLVTPNTFKLDVNTQAYIATESFLVETTSGISLEGDGGVNISSNGLTENYGGEGISITTKSKRDPINIITTKALSDITISASGTDVENEQVSNISISASGDTNIAANGSILFDSAKLGFFGVSGVSKRSWTRPRTSYSTSEIIDSLQDLNDALSDYGLIDPS